MTRVVLFTLLAIVATAAVVLSLSALDELGQVCGFGPLSLLLPLVLDAGAAAGTVAWLARTGRPREFGRVLALLLLGGSVAATPLTPWPPTPRGRRCGRGRRLRVPPAVLVRWCTSPPSPARPAQRRPVAGRRVGNVARG